jgi:hypothetical protein
MYELSYTSGRISVFPKSNVLDTSYELKERARSPRKKNPTLNMAFALSSDMVDVMVSYIENRVIEEIPFAIHFSLLIFLVCVSKQVKSEFLTAGSGKAPFRQNYRVHPETVRQ